MCAVGICKIASNVYLYGFISSILQVDPLRSGVDSYGRNQRWNDSPRQMSHRVIEDDDYTLTHVED